MSTTLHEADFAVRDPDGRMHCTLCPFECRIADGARGACAVRYHQDGTLYTLTYGRIAAQSVDPIEKKPFFHVLPGTRAFSIAAAGCNLQCTYCQNWAIAQWPRDELPRHLGGPHHEASLPLEALAFVMPGEAASPDAIVDAAVAAGAASIAYTYTEPTIYFELAYDIAVRARARGLRNLFVTNGYISEAPLRKIAPVLDAANVDLKFFRETSYRHVSRAGLQPVLDAIRLYRDLGVWIEVTTLVIPGVNDADEELRDIAAFVRSVGADVPWHVSAFAPTYRMTDRPPTPLDTLRRAARIGVDAGLRHVYEGNVPGSGAREHTVCPACATVLIERRGFVVLANRLVHGRCPTCDAAVAGVWTV
ncbi:MAG TPA: AmmeMemoRadiSam system radical SAM enzyme [Vicinamibacterales bacterium]|nr:AmmeMemoRadiSam system radical SAM enzyme [Vicinamibacterales bacterium]